MKNSQRQSMKMQQRLTPQQLLLMQLLQQPVTLLEQSLKEEVEKNPLLEMASSTENMESLPDSSAQEDDALAEYEEETDDYAYREQLQRDRNQELREVAYAADVSASERLLEQLGLKDLTDRQQLIAQEIIGSIDDAGYLSRDVDLIANDLAFTQGIEVSREELLSVLRIVQDLDPAGIGARNVQECLSIQLHRADEADEATRLAIQVVDTCFDLFTKHNFDRIMERLGIDEEQLDEAMARIRRLNPKPGIGESVAAHAHYIVPDFIVTRHDDDIQLSLNDGRLPQIQINGYYQEMLQQMLALRKPSPSERETIEFLRGKTDSATMLLDTLRQRQVTMVKVMQVVMRRQHRFFVTGDFADLKPLLQKDVAEATGFDISTISRVVNSKYVQTEFGTFLLKECFSQSLVTDDGEEVATETIRQEMQQAVDAEDKQNPMTDDDLAKFLNGKGYPVARRTVAKYREMLGIPVARLRRQLKIAIFFVLAFSSVAVFAQQPQRESYFDSIVNARIRQGQAQSRAEAAKKAGKESKGKETKGKSGHALEIHEPEPDPNAIDTALASGDDLIDVIYNASLPAPSALWYGNNLSGALVRLRNLSMDSLPDEVTIRLVKGEEKFCFPVKNIITSPYGWRWNRPHRGVDVRLKTGDPVRCAFNGVVRIARPMGAYGNLVVVRHYNGLETVYGHLSQIKVKPLQVVRAGQVLGLGGSTGRSTGPHLHFEVRFQYEPFDPEWILDFSNYSLRTRKLYLDKTYFGIRKPRVGDGQEFKADKSIVPEEPVKMRKKAPDPVYVTMKRGDTLEKLAEKYHTSVDRIKTLNPDVEKFKTGVKIRVI